MTPSELRAVPAELQKELATFELLKPFIAHCLALNHDLNNPLAGIVGYCEFLTDEGKDMTDDQQEYVRQIMKCTERIQKIIQNLCREKSDLAEKIDIQGLMAEYTAPREQS